MESHSPERIKSASASRRRTCLHPLRRIAAALAPAAFLLIFHTAWAGQAQTSLPQPTQAPQSSVPAPQKSPDVNPCQVNREATAAVQAGAAGAVTSSSANLSLNPTPKPEPCPPLAPRPGAPLIDWYARFINGPQVKALTPRQKAHLAARDLLDPFNGITILGNSAIFVAANPHSPYGPGMPGFGRNVGVSFTQDMTGEFFGTFLIPSLVHQDPHYHRLPHATIPRRIAHAIYQVVWTQGDDGRGMLNYANLGGFAIDDAIGNLYVPGQQTNLPASVSRYATGLASAPIDNFITEFLPDVARRIHVRVVLVQRIINQVAKSGNTEQ